MSSSKYVEFFIMTLIASISSTPILWLITHWILKITFFVLLTLLIMAIFFIIKQIDLKIKLRYVITNLNRTFGLFHLSISVVITLDWLNLVSIGEVFRLISVVFVSSFSIGYILAKILKLDRYFKKLELVVFSYLIGYTFSSLIGLSSSLLSQVVKPGFVFLLSNFVFALYMLIAKTTNNTCKTISKDNSHSLVTAFVFTILVLFLVIQVLLMYPSVALISSFDVARLWSNANVLLRGLGDYISLLSLRYIAFNAYIASIIPFSEGNFISLQSILVFLNFMPVIAFYLMANAYFGSAESRAPLLSTIIWTSFSSFSWLYFVRLVTTSSIDRTIATTLAADRLPVLVGSSLMWPWGHLPIVVNYVFLFFLMYLIKREDLPNRAYYSVVILFLFASIFTHLVETLIFVIFSLAYALITHNARRTLAPIVSSLLPSLLVYVSVRGDVEKTVIFFISFLVAILIITYFFFKQHINTLFCTFRKAVMNAICWASKHKLGITFTLYLIYLASVVIWIDAEGLYSLQGSSDIWFIPWYIYPLMTGIGGLLAILGIYIVLRDYLKFNNMLIFLVFGFFVIFLAKFVSIINTYFIIDYWEVRIANFLPITIAPFASVGLLRIFHLGGIEKSKLHKKIFHLLLIGFIIVMAISSTLIRMEGEVYSVERENKIKGSELNALLFLKSQLEINPKGLVFTITDESYNNLNYATSAYNSQRRWIHYSSIHADSFLRSLMSYPYDVYVYLHQRDSAILRASFNKSYLAHLIEQLSPIFDNGIVQIYKLPRAFPSGLNSNISLIIPFDLQTEFEQYLFYSYDIISAKLCNYTTILDRDAKLFSFPCLILPYDPTLPSSSMFQESFDHQIFNENWTIPSGGKWDQCSKDCWEIKDSSLIAKPPAGSGKGAIILSPVKVSNFFASVDIMPIKINSDVGSNLAGMVLPCEGLDNYVCVWLHFWKDKHIYILIYNYQGEKFDPLIIWPGFKSKFTWNENSTYKLSVLVDGGNLQIYINGELQTSLPIKGISGHVGLEARNMEMVSFDNFLVKALSPGYNEYLQYLSNGGQLIVFNPMGTGDFADLVLKDMNSSFYAKRISGILSSIELNAEIEVRYFNPKQNVEVLSWYENQGYASPLVLRKNIGSGQIIYVNIEPFVKAVITTNDIKSNLFINIRKVLDISDILPSKLTNIENYRPILAYSKNIELYGNININTESFLLSSEGNVDLVMDFDGKYLSLANITILSLSMEGINAQPIFISPAVKIEGGNALYTKVEIKGTFILEFTKTPISIHTIERGEYHNYYIKAERGKVIISGDRYTAFFKNLKVFTDGETKINKLYLNDDLLYRRTGANGHNLQIIGFTSFEIERSETFVFITELSLEGECIRTPPIVRLNELEILVKTLPYVLITIIVFTLCYMQISKGDKF